MKENNAEANVESKLTVMEEDERPAVVRKSLRVRTGVMAGKTRPIFPIIMTG
jgi:hypothetical protein